uniref:putative bifunctional diguanylate cyclase/phosphodiesterase n=1 Tax=Pelomonas sp. KK5 TaxID=1855730 RepID=UPI00097C8420
MTLRILFADDDSSTRSMMRALLRRLGAEVTLAVNGMEALMLFRASPQDMVLLDVDMPGMDGYEVCTTLRREAGELLPIVMVTGMDYGGSVERAYECGATDFIAKPINWAMLGHRLRHLIRNHQTQLALQAAEGRAGELTISLRRANEELRAANETLQRRAFEDPLSGLPNRSLFNHKLERALARHARRDAASPTRLAVMFIDLDGFKPVNDSFGHAAGDAVLRDVARRLRTVAREGETLARLGGDEFVMLIESSDAVGDAMKRGQRIIEMLRQPFVLGEQQVTLSCSIGVVVHPDQERDGHRLLACADAAMFTAKRIGGGTCVLYEAGMAEDGTQQLLMQQALRETLDRGLLALEFQPKLESLRGRIRGLEALLRWQHPRFGPVSPAVFIPLAERFGMIGAIGNWVIDQACAQLAAWRDQGLGCHVAINLSPHQLRQADLHERISQALQRHALDPTLLVCEITESAMMENNEEERGQLRHLAALGVRLSIDDFGTGYSSLAQLRYIPARQLKIDRSFIVDLADSATARAMVEAIVRLGHALGMEVVAEGVEEEEQLQVLRELRCDLLQGFYIAPPMPAEAVPKWLAGREVAKREGRETSFDSELGAYAPTLVSKLE